MLAIRLQRRGRKGHAQFRVIVQDAARSPSSGRVVARLGHYDPHSKQTVIDKDKAVFYLENGARPSPRAVSLLKTQKIKMPAWLEAPAKKKRQTKNPDKLRKNRPAEKQTQSDTTTEKPKDSSEDVTAPTSQTEAEDKGATKQAADTEEPKDNTPEKEDETSQKSNEDDKKVKDTKAKDSKTSADK